MEQKYSHLINRDRSIRLLAKNACFRAIFVKSTNLSREAAERHNLNSKASILLSKIMTAAALIASTLKGEERAIIELISNGYFKKVLGEASQNGEIRGYVQINDNLTNSNIEIGSGYFMVTRILYDHAEPLTGIIELQDGDIDANLSYYYYKSEQIPTGVIISAELDSDGIIKYAGGLMVQAMPGYKRNDLEKIYNSMNQIKSLEEAILCDENQSIEFLKNHLPFDFDILKSQILDFFCRCSKESFIQKLSLLNLEELKEMQHLHQTELVCQYCNAHYYLDEEELENIITQKSALQN
ncbi:MAG TPA: Hsp33 family molecular chaperone HslO [Candidatus Kapabacteria bacterium]|nr:Hsp33 family molecular chaperone HslO [Candidatus Kapabacteria bacterium]HOV92407.1 Hsp33 family molecular chaperone HslO [Candidatus Kapabacteria bacterium]